MGKELQMLLPVTLTSAIESFFDEWLARGEEMEAGSEVQCLPFRDYFIRNQHNLTHISQGLWTGLAHLVESTLAVSDPVLLSFTRSVFFSP